MRSKSLFVASIAILSALSVVFDIMSDQFPLRVPWGMKIDFVGTTWLVAYFLFGFAEALCVSSITAVYMAFLGPTGIVGATMKFIATVSMFGVFELLMILPFVRKRTFKNPIVMTATSVMAILARVVSTCVVNYYWAVPIWVGPDFMEKLFGGSIMAFVAFVVGMNLLQSLVDIVIPWSIALRLGFFLNRKTGPSFKASSRQASV